MRLDPKADILSVVKDSSKPIKTPIFTSKISFDKMLNHLADKIDGDRRLEYINLVKPTLEKPLFITQESISGAQRFRFFKTFIDEKDKVVKFLNVVEDKNGELIEITATPIKNTDLKEKYKEEKKEILINEKIISTDLFHIKPVCINENDKILNFACGLEKNEAKRIVRRIKAFLEKQKIYF